LTLANFPVRNVKKQENNNGELRRNIIDKKCRWVIELFFVDLFTTPVFIASHLGILGNPSTIVVAWIEAFSNKSNYRSTWQQTWQGGEHSFGNETHGQRVQIVWIIFLVDSKFFLLLVFFELIKIFTCYICLFRWFIHSIVLQQTKIVKRLPRPQTKLSISISENFMMIRTTCCINIGNDTN
jgi:hypothetical protein